MTKPQATLEGQLLALIRGMVRAEVDAALAKAQPEPEAADYLTTRKAAEYAKVAPGTLRRWIREGRIAASHAGRYHRVKRADLDRLLHDGPVDDDASPEEEARQMFRSLA